MAWAFLTYVLQFSFHVEDAMTSLSRKISDGAERIIVVCQYWRKWWWGREVQLKMYVNEGRNSGIAFRL